MAGVDVKVLLLAAGVLAVLGWYALHIVSRTRQAAQAIKALPEAMERSFDGSVPPWLRLIRFFMIVLICLASAVLIVRKLGLG